MAEDSFDKYSGQYGRYQGIKQETSNRFLNLFHLKALDRSNKPFDYYMASRNCIASIKPISHSNNPEGMAIFAIVENANQEDRIVLIRQYRYPLDAYIYELPAGLIEKGETAEDAAIREMFEETGLQLLPEKNDDYNILSKNPFYLAQGLTDESGVIICGKATGQVSYDNLEASEDIKVCLLTRAEARHLLETEPFSMRAGLMVWHWILT